MTGIAPHIAVVIVGFRNADDIGRCLAALATQTYANIEVVVVENGGALAYEALRPIASAIQIAGREPRLIDAGANLGFAGGVNRGMAESADVDAWWVLNPDTQPAPDALDHLVERLSRGDCQAVGGVLHFPEGRVQGLGGQWQAWIGRAVSLGSGRHVDDPVDAGAIEGEMDYLLGASMLIGRAFLQAVGPMRDDYFLYAEEIEWFLRGGQRGMKLGFAPAARVLHHQGTTTGWAGQLRGRGRMPTYLDERNRLLVTRDRLPWRFPIVAATSMAFMLARFGSRRAWRQIGYGLDGWLAAIRGERGMPRWMRPSA